MREFASPNNSPSELLTGYVKEQDRGWVTIACDSTRVIVSRYQDQFEKDGWQPEPIKVPAEALPSLK